MSRTWWRWARLLGGVAILAVLLWRLGTGPFLDAIGLINGRSLAAASGIAALTTVCCAWRWSLVARGLGVGVPRTFGMAGLGAAQGVTTAVVYGLITFVATLPCSAVLIAAWLHRAPRRHASPAPRRLYASASAGGAAHG